MKSLRLSFEERQFIEESLKKHYSCRKISSLMNRGTNTILNEVNRSGGRETYKAEEAQKKAIERILKIRRNKKEPERESGYITFSERLDNLDMQVQILTETIKEMLDENRKNK